MNILVVCQYYQPEPFRVHDICAELVRAGHSVQVVTGMPNYPKGELYPGFEKNQPVDEELDGVRIHRCPIHPRKTGSLHRLWNYASFPASASRYLRSKRFSAAECGAFDLVFVYQLSPVMMASPGIRYAKRRRIPVVLYCLDLWPESLLAGGVRRGSIIYRYFHRVSKKIYSSIDKLLITSNQFSRYLQQEFSLPEERIEYLPQYAEEFFSALPAREPDGTTNLMFAGNLGSLQSLDTILDAASMLKDEPVRFLIVGDGKESGHLEQRIKRESLKNVSLMGRRPVEKMPGLYAGADAMLVTMKTDPVLSLTLPGKVQSYLASGRPVIGAVDGEAARVIEESGCGFCGPAEDASALAENVRRFMLSDGKAEMGRRAAAYYAGHFTKTQFMARIEPILRHVVDCE